MDFTEIIVKRSEADVDPVTFGREECAPSKGFGPAVRTHWLLHYIVRGKGRFRRDGVTYAVKAGEIFSIPPFVETYYEADTEDPWEYIWIGFTASGQCKSLLAPPIIRCAGIGPVFEDMCRCREMENGKYAFLRSKIWELVAFLQEADHHAAGHIDKALSLMHAEYTDGINVAAVAARLNLERSYFSTLFKRTVGVSPVDYLTTLRLDKAAELLGRGETPSTAAVSVGYADYCHFSKAFKHRFGCSPRSYRNA